jgi:hypothetical protein
MTAATSLRGVATGRPVWFANVDLPLLSRQVIARRNPRESVVVPALPLAENSVPIG